MNGIRLLSPLACVAAAAALSSCANGLERYPAAIDYDQLELRKSAFLEERSRAPAAHRGEHAELLEQMDLQLEQRRREEELTRTRRIEFLEQANREQMERYRDWETGHESTARQRAALRARSYPTREEGLELLRRSEQTSQGYRRELHSRYTWTQRQLYIGGPERIEREAAALRARYEEHHRTGTLEGLRLLDEARRQTETREREVQEAQERYRQFALQQASASSLAPQPNGAVVIPKARTAGAPVALTGAAPAVAPGPLSAGAGAAPAGTAPVAAPAAPPAGP
jgi:hypothetical protein